MNFLTFGKYLVYQISSASDIHERDTFSIKFLPLAIGNNTLLFVKYSAREICLI